MASITIRNLPDATKHTLRVRAAEQGMSMEAYVRRLLQEASAEVQEPQMTIIEAAKKFFGPFNGIDDLELPSRRSHRTGPTFDE